MNWFKQLFTSPTNFFGGVSKLAGAVVGAQVVLSTMPPPHLTIPVPWLTAAVSVSAICGYLAHYFSADNSDVPKLPTPVPMTPFEQALRATYQEAMKVNPALAKSQTEDQFVAAQSKTIMPASTTPTTP